MPNNPAKILSREVLVHFKIFIPSTHGEFPELRAALTAINGEVKDFFNPKTLHAPKTVGGLTFHFSVKPKNEKTFLHVLSTVCRKAGIVLEHGSTLEGLPEDDTDNTIYLLTLLPNPNQFIMLAFPNNAIQKDFINKFKRAFEPLEIPPSPHPEVKTLNILFSLSGISGDRRNKIFMQTIEAREEKMFLSLTQKFCEENGLTLKEKEIE